MTATHCQICARDIKANTGIIAHHGYQRPGLGWQSASCEGARQLPYEVSRDYIPVVIERYTLWEKNQNDLADQIFREPPVSITRTHKNLYSGKIDTETFERPADFDATKAINNEYGYYQEYAKEYRNQYLSHRKNAKEIAEAIVFLQDRFDKWVKVA